MHYDNDRCPDDLGELTDLRRRFRALTIVNANYFGNLPGSGQPSALKVVGNTTFEDIGCVGYQPQTDRLEAVIYVKQPQGYGGNLCGNGSNEFVRFYGSWNNGTSWHDLGMSVLQVWDIPQGTEGAGRLEYAVTLHTSLVRRICRKPQIVLIRAILSWNQPPPANTPDFPPVWGDVHDTHILIEPKRRWRVKDLFEAVEIESYAEIADLFDPEATVTAKANPLPLHALQQLYKDSDVPAKRFALPQLSKALTGTVFSPGWAAGDFTSAAGAFQFDPSILDELLNPGDGDTTYEELECVGYDPREDCLVGTVRIKRSAGYSGGLCTDGSREYVTFWADLDGTGSFETCLGTADVRVYDIRNFPDEGLEFAVHLPAGLVRYRRPCRQGPRLIPIRAVLSWQVPVPCSEPDRTPVWGNRVETLIHVAPGKEVDDTLSPELAHVGAVQIDHIQPNGLTDDTHALSGLRLSQSPFGGRIDLAGKILNGNAGTRYRIMLREQGIGVWLPLNLNGVSVTVVTPGPIFTSTPLVADADGYYGYEDYSFNHYVVNQILGSWGTSSLHHGKTYELRLDVKDPGGTGPDIQGEVVAVHIDNEGPTASLEFTLVAGDCAHFDEKAVFEGKFTATDEYFGYFRFEILPDGPAAHVLPTPPLGTSEHFIAGGIPDPGVINATFQLDTGGGPPPVGAPGPMQPCGYALVLHVSDRTNVNSGATHHQIKDSVGFCLGSPPHA
jgi:hypothetical protein